MKVTSIPNNPSLEGLAYFVSDVVYSRETGTDLKLTAIAPQRAEGEARLYPIIVFVQGSAWTFPKRDYEYAQLAQFAQAGYVVATITHRNSLDGHPFPAFLQDVKTAIRFMRENAATYGGNPERVCIWGTSSGGNAALLAGLTGDDPRYKTGECAAQSDAVQLVVECFGPADLVRMLRPERFVAGEANVFYQLARGQDANEVMRAMSPYYQVEDKKAYPPFLLIHGDADEIVPYDQSERMCERLLAAGADAELIRVVGAPHEGNFWSQRLLQMILDYIREKL